MRAEKPNTSCISKITKEENERETKDEHEETRSIIYEDK